MSNYVFVHGAFVDGSYWRDVAAILEKQGHRVVVVEQLPSAGRGPRALGDLKADTDCVRQTVESVGEPVVLVGHSYGGMVITELADHPAVAHTVYLSAFWPTQGQSVVDLLGGGPLPDWLVLHDDGTLEMTDDIEVRRHIECGDVDPERAAVNLRAMVPQSVTSFGAPSTAPESPSSNYLHHLRARPSRSPGGAGAVGRSCRQRRAPPLVASADGVDAGPAGGRPGSNSAFKALTSPTWQT